MIPFLQSVAEAYSKRFNRNGEITPDRYCFVFPNKRAGTFFLKYLREVSPEGMIAPQVTTITDLVTDLSGRIVNSRIDLIFLLYNCYCELLFPGCPPEKRHEKISFDAFRKWGETVLRDFNEVDMQNVDADKIFKNVKDFKEIAADFLTDEQRKVMEEYFGYTAPTYTDDKLWINFESTKPGLSDKFISLWRILGPLYRKFHAAMEERGLISSGGAYRLSAERLREAVDKMDPSLMASLLPWDKLVFVGFNALSKSEREIFHELKRLPSPADADEPLTDFIWDATGPVLSDRKNSAGRFVAININHFPAPDWVLPTLAKSNSSSFPEMTEVAAPSKVMQVKIATQIINEMKSGEVDEETFKDARVALVVPDEGLLLPLLYSMPKNLGDINLTMGYPLRLTAVTSFLVLLRRLQITSRDSKSYRGYALDQIRDLLSHPYSHAIFITQKINRFIADKERRHVNVVREHELLSLGPKAERVLRPLPKDAASSEVIDYLNEVLKVIGETLIELRQSDSDNSRMLKDSLELHHVEAWRDALKVFSDSIEEYGVRLSVAATLSEAYRLLQAEIVPFEGEPLHGLQIMGMLETRALDFDHLVIVGLNDRTIPGRMRQRSFIPNVIRHGFGMPPNTYQEDIFGYYFFRLISRAKRVTFIYDSRVTGGNGGESRYLLQLRYLYAPESVRRVEYKFSLAGREKHEISIQKNPFVKSRLDRFFNPEPSLTSSSGKTYRKNFTASLLKKFTACPVKFYYEGVLDLRDDPQPTPSIDAITLGNIVHDVMEKIYLPDKSQREVWLIPPVRISPNKISALLSKEGMAEIKDHITRYINLNHYQKPQERALDELQVDTELVREIVMGYIRNILEADLKEAPFNLYGVEIRNTFEYPLSDGRRLNVQYALDRVDNIGCEKSENLSEPEMIRIVDYKTGGSHIDSLSISHLFDSDYLKDNLLQLLTYAEFIRKDSPFINRDSMKIGLSIYPVAKMKQSKEKDKIPFIAGKRISHDRMLFPDETAAFRAGFNSSATEEIGIESAINEAPAEISDQFRIMLNKILEGIFSDKPFEAAVTPKKCDNCPFLAACSS